MEYIVHLKSLVIKAKDELSAKRKAEEKLLKGFKLPEIMIDEVKENEFQE